MSLSLATWQASRNAECGLNSAWTMESLSSTTTQPPRSVTCIAPWMLTASRWGDQRMLQILTNARQQQQQLLPQPHLQQQLVVGDRCFCYCCLNKVFIHMIMVFCIFIPGTRCPDGWTQDGTSCYFLSIDLIPLVADAIKFCQDLGSTLVEVTHSIYCGLAR